MKKRILVGLIVFLLFGLVVAVAYWAFIPVLADETYAVEEIQVSESGIGVILSSEPDIWAFADMVVSKNNLENSSARISITLSFAEAFVFESNGKQHYFFPLESGYYHFQLMDENNEWYEWRVSSADLTRWLNKTPVR